MTEHEQLVQLCVGLGSPQAQAEIMAKQLAKRVDQLAATRGISRVEAMRHLLEVLVKGRMGEGPDGSGAQ
ncbi:hypothetical protein DB347_03260 [Opitutaceae bacterium EW11]|nr:hypothetical protein DB347_03260 [Opitutaceae bacterium EW11]